jgi:hypothetical protein
VISGSMPIPNAATGRDDDMTALRKDARWQLRTRLGRDFDDISL